MTQSKASSWSEADDELLLHWQAKLGNKWSAIAKHIPGHTGAQCAQRWRRKVASRQWAASDDAALAELVAKHGNDWAEVSRRLGGWSSQQCKDRWQLQLAPAVKKAASQWSAEEDRLLLQLHAQSGGAWSAVARGLGQHRTHQQCRARWLRLHNGKAISKDKTPLSRATAAAVASTPSHRYTRTSQRAASMAPAARVASHCSSHGREETSTSVAQSDTSTSDAESQQAVQTVLKPTKPQKRGSLVLGRRSVRYPTRSRTTRHKAHSASRRRTSMPAAAAPEPCATTVFVDLAAGSGVAVTDGDKGHDACHMLVAAAGTSVATPSWRLWSPVAGALPPLMAQTLHRSASFESGMLKPIDCDQVGIVRAKSAPAICTSTTAAWGSVEATGSGRQAAGLSASPVQQLSPSNAHLAMMTPQPPSPASGPAVAVGLSTPASVLPAPEAAVPAVHVEAAAVAIAPEQSPLMHTPVAAAANPPAGGPPAGGCPPPLSASASQAVSQWSDVPALSWSDWRQAGQGMGIVTSPGQVGTVCSKRTQHSLEASPVGGGNGGRCGGGGGGGNTTPCGGRVDQRAAAATAVVADDMWAKFMVGGDDMVHASNAGGPTRPTAGSRAPANLSAAPACSPHRPAMATTPGKRAVRSVRRLDQHDVFVAVAAQFSPPPPHRAPPAAATLVNAAAACGGGLPDVVGRLLSPHNEGCGECSAEVCILGGGGRGGPLSHSFSGGGSPSKKPCLVGMSSSLPVVAGMEQGGPLALRSISSEALPTRPPPVDAPSAMLQGFIAHVTGAGSCRSAVRPMERLGGGVGDAAAAAPVPPGSAPLHRLLLPGADHRNSSASSPSTAPGRARRQLVLEDTGAHQGRM